MVIKEPPPGTCGPLTVEYEFVAPPQNDPSSIIIYFLGEMNNHKVIQAYKIGLVPSSLDLRLLTESFVHRIEEGNTFSHILYLHNPLLSTTTIQNVASSNEAIKVVRPWDIRDKLKEPNNSYDAVSPADFWKVESNTKKPIGEITFTAPKDKHSKKPRLLAEGWVQISLKQVIASSDSTINRELFIPLRFYKKHTTPLFDEEIIDMGVLTTKDTAHRYNLMVENRFGKPAVITKVSVSKKGFGIVFKVATPFSYKVVLPVGIPGFELLSLIATPEEKAQYGFLSGTITIQVDVFGQLEEFSVPFQVGFYHNMISNENLSSFELKRVVKDNRVVNKLDGVFQNNFMTDLIIGDLSFVNFENKEGTSSWSSLVKNKRVAPGEIIKAYMGTLTYNEYNFDNAVSRGHELIYTHTLGSVVSLSIRYFTMHLMCGLHNTMSESFQKCKNIQKLEFGYIALNHKKVVTMDILNPTQVSCIIKRIEFSSGNGNVELSFENQSRNSLKSYFKKASHTMNTFVLISAGDVVSVRVKIKPRETGNFKESITLFTNHGEFSLSIVYKGIQGDILFTPSVLRFDLFYPIESDEKSVVAKNKFNIDVEINGAWSPQSFLFAHLKKNYLKENSKENFLGVILDLSDDDLVHIKRPNFMKTIHHKYVTLSDLVAQNNHVEGWKKIVKEGKSEISGEVIIQTDLLNEMKIGVKGQIKKANFVPDEVLDAGDVEEKRSHYVNVTLHNPTERDVAMYFYIGDENLMNLKKLTSRIMKSLKKRYSRYSKEQICLSHSDLESDEVKYYANILFDGVSFKTTTLSLKNNKKKVCFVVNQPDSAHIRFFGHKGDYLFNSTKISRDKLIKDNLDVYVLKDILKLSKRLPPTSHQTLMELSFMEKINILLDQLKDHLLRKLNRRKKFKNFGSKQFIRSASRVIVQELLDKQQFFINPEYAGKRVIIPPGETVSLPILVCHPTQAGEIKTKLLIKNNYSRLITLPVTARAGRVSLSVQKVIYMAEGATTSIIQKKEDSHKMPFTIHSSDLVQKLTNKKYAFKKVVKRVFELKNTGNLAITVKYIAVENQGCSFDGFKILNCEGFDLGPGQTHRMEIVLLNAQGLQPDLKREVYFILEARVLVLEFEVFSADPLITELTPFSSEAMTDTPFKGLITCFVIILAVLGFKHRQEKTKPTLVVTTIEKAQFGDSLFVDNIFDLKAVEANVKYHGAEKEKKAMIRQIGLKDMMRVEERSNRDDTSRELTDKDLDDDKEILEATRNILPEDIKVPEPKQSRKDRKANRKKAEKLKAEAQKKEKERREQEELLVQNKILEDSPKKQPSPSVPAFREPSPPLKPAEEKVEKSDKNKSRRELSQKTSVEVKAPSTTKEYLETRKSELILEDKPQESKPKEINKRKYRKQSSENSFSVHSESIEAIGDQRKKGRKNRKVSDTYSRDSHNDSNTDSYQKQRGSYREKEQPLQRAREKDKRKQLVSEKDYGRSERPDKKNSQNQRQQTKVYYQRVEKSDSSRFDDNSSRRSQSEDRETRKKNLNENIKDENLAFPPLPPPAGTSATNPDNIIDSKAIFGGRKASRTSTNPLEALDTSQTGSDQLPNLQPTSTSASQHLNQPIPPGETSFDHRFNQMISFNDRDISEIENRGEEASCNTSNINILKENMEEIKEPGDKESEGEDSDDYDQYDTQRSHEKIRKLMEDTEEVKDNFLEPEETKEHEIKRPGVIGGGVKRKNEPKVPAAASGGSSLLGFRHSENSHHYERFGWYDSSSMAFNQGFSYMGQHTTYQRDAPSGQMFPEDWQRYPPQGYPAHGPPGMGGLLPQKQFQGQGGYGGGGGYSQQQQQPQGPTQRTWKAGGQNLKVHSHQYGTLIPKHQMYNVGMQQQQPQHQPLQPQPPFQPYQHQQQPPMDSFQPQIEGMDSGSNSGGYDEEVFDAYGSGGGLGYGQRGYYGRENYNYEEQQQTQGMGHTGQQGNTFKQFKAAMNNPFTLSKLAMNKTEGQNNQNQPQQGYSSGAFESYQSSSVEENGLNSSRLKGMMKPPPGLGDSDGDGFAPKEEAQKDESQADKSGSALGVRSTTDKSTKSKKTDNSNNYNMF